MEYNYSAKINLQISIEILLHNIPILLMLTKSSFQSHFTMIHNSRSTQVFKVNLTKCQMKKIYLQEASARKYKKTRIIFTG